MNQIMQGKRVINLNYINERRNILNNDYNEFKFVKYINDILLRDDVIQSNETKCILQLQLEPYRKIYVIVQDYWLQQSFVRQKMLEVDTKISIGGRFEEFIDSGGNNIMLIYLNKSNSNFMNIADDNLQNVSSLQNFADCDRMAQFSQMYDFYIKKQSEVGLIGTICHNLFEKICEDQSENIQDYFNQYVQQQIIQNCKFFSEQGDENFDGLVKQLLEFCPMALKFRKTYIEKQTQIEQGDIKIIITKIVNVEYPFNSKFGFKGKIDMVLEGTVFKNNICQGIKTIPFELKTGNKYIDKHQYQAFIYNLCYNEKYIENEYSLLYYTKTNEFEIIQNNKRILQSTFHMRNNVVFAILQKQISKNIQGKQICRYCNYKQQCMFEYVKDRDDLEIIPNSQEYNGIFENVKKLTSKGLYTKQKLDKTKKIIMGIEKEDNYQQEIKKSKSYFRKSFIFSNIQSCHFLLNSNSQYQLAIMDKILKDEHYTDEEILNTFTIGQRISLRQVQIFGSELLGRIESRFICFYDKTKILKIAIKIEQRQLQKLFFNIPQNSLYQIRYSQNWIIKEQDYNSIGKMKSILPQILDEEEDLADILYGNKHFENRLSQQNIVNFNNIENKLNENQVFAIKNSLAQERFHLIRGVPGSGKSRLIAYLLKELIKQKRKILLCTYTHKSLNYILHTLWDILNEDQRTQVLRLVSKNQCERFEVFEQSKIITMNQYAQIQGKKVFATTLQSIKQYNFCARDFDYAVIDQASIVLEPLLIVPLMFCKKFIMVGNYTNMYPIVESDQKNILNIPLFDKLCSKYSQKVTKLPFSYTMTGNVLKVANKFFYNNNIKYMMEQNQYQYLNFKVGENQEWISTMMNVNSNLFVVNTSRNYVTQQQTIVRNANEISNFSAFDLQGNFVTENYMNTFVDFLLLNDVQKKDILILGTATKEINYLKQLIDDKEIKIIQIDKSYNYKKKYVLISLDFQNVQVERQEHKRNINIALTRALKSLVIFTNVNQIMDSQNQDLKDILNFLKTINNESIIEHEKIMTQYQFHYLLIFIIYFQRLQVQTF